MEPVRTIDELAFNAWPAPVCQVVDGWVHRYGWGATRRANSAWPAPAAEGDLEARIDAVASAYRRWGAPPRVQVTDGLVAGLDEHLAERGWMAEGACHVMASDLTATIAATPAAATLQLAVTPDAEWIASWWGAGRGGTPPPGAERIVGLPLPSVVHARRHDGGRWACVGRAVYERGWVGLFAIATDPEQRGRGHASALIGGLARWAVAAGARRAYLQVEVDNAAARRLFTRLGFVTVGGYHYRTLAS